MLNRFASRSYAIVCVMTGAVLAAGLAGCAALPVSSPGTAPTPLQRPKIELTADAARSANDALHSMNIVCDLVTNAEVRDIGIQHTGSGGREDCDYGTLQGPDAYVRVAVGVTSSEGVDSLVKSATTGQGTSTEDLRSVNGTVVTTLRSRPNCVAVAQRPDGAFVVLTIAKPVDAETACDDASRLVALAVGRLPTL